MRICEYGGVGEPEENLLALGLVAQLDAHQRPPLPACQRDAAIFQRDNLSAAVSRVSRAHSHRAVLHYLALKRN